MIMQMKKREEMKINTTVPFILPDSSSSQGGGK